LKDERVDNTLPGYIPMPKEDALERKGTELKTHPVTGKQSISVDRLLQNKQSVRLIIPATLKEGVFGVELKDANNGKAYFYVNVPVVRWVISEEGLKVTAGDCLRIQGKNLWRTGNRGQAVLVSLDGKTVIRTKTAKVYDDYSVSVNMPANIPDGEYHLYYHNGLGGKTAWSEPLKVDVVHKTPAKAERQIFNVKDYGARGDGINNETAAIRAALFAAEQNGGGTVYVPCGRYMLTGQLILAPNTILNGESKELTQLFWNPLNWDTNELPGSLISGTHHFAVKNLNLWASRAWGVILSTGPVSEQGNITLENLIVKQTAQLSGLVYQVKANRDAVDAELNSRWTKTGIILRGENLKIRNCIFNSSGMYTFFAASGFIQNCRFERTTTGVNQPYMLIHPKGLIFEDCYKQGDGYGYAATIDESENLYEARNTIPYNYTNDRECMTFDGGSGAYSGNIGTINGAVLTLPKDAVTHQWTENKWIGGGVYIIEGKGTGQYRRIVSHTLTNIELDQPFLVDPDTSSVISITTIRRNMFFVNNTVTDCGAYQFYGSAQNCVISGLKMRRCNGIICRGSLLYSGKQPNWYIDIVNCELNEGNYTHWFGIEDRGHSGHQNINMIGSGGSGLNIGVLVRRNQLNDFSYIRTSPGANANAITDLIIEDNSFRLSKKAILLGGTGNHTSNVLIHNNRYSEVEKQIETGIDTKSYLILDDNKSSVQPFNKISK
jgi:hypothetical protein